MRIHCLTHVPFEGPAAIADWARERGHELELVPLHAGAPPPAPDASDMVVSMGGPMSANDDARFPWLGPEIDLVAAAVEAGKPVLGVCLGAQILARALGGRVMPGPAKEIGWFPAEAVRGGGPLDRLPARFTPLHWHGEVFEAPPGAACLARTEAWPQQAFAYGPRALGLQFHLEATAQSVDELVENAGHEIGHGRFEQAPERIRAGAARAQGLHPTLFGLLDTLLAPG